ncbi:MAG: MATE family efflux transporter [Bullifex sp.]
MNKDLTVGNVRGTLVRFILPLLGSMIFQQMYNITDSLVAGKLISSSALAAVGNSYEITLVYISFAFGINMGCSVVVSQLFGAKRYGDVKSAISTTFIYTFCLCLLLMGAGLVFTDMLLELIQTPAELMAPSAEYLDIYIYGVFFLFFYNVATGIFSAMGDSRTPFIFLAFSSVLNIIVDIIFVAVFHMGVAGVAWATFMCQGLSSVVSCAVLFRRLKSMVHEGKAVLFSFPLLGKILKVAVPSTCQQLFVSVGNIMIQSVINSFGAVVMAAYAAAIKLNNMVITTLTTLGSGVSSFVAQNIGAGKSDRVKSGYRNGLGIGILFIIPVTVLFFFFGKYLLIMFVSADESEIIEAGRAFQMIVSPFYAVVAVKIITDAVLRGMGRMLPFVISTFADLILRVALAFIFSAFLGYIGIWLSWPVGWLVGTVLSVVFYIRSDKGKSVV